MKDSRPPTRPLTAWPPGHFIIESVNKVLSKNMNPHMSFVAPLGLKCPVPAPSGAPVPASPAPQHPRCHAFTPVKGLTQAPSRNSSVVYFPSSATSSLAPSKWAHDEPTWGPVWAPRGAHLGPTGARVGPIGTSLLRPPRLPVLAPTFTASCAGAF
jgi:hypothetical protein